MRWFAIAWVIGACARHGDVVRSQIVISAELPGAGAETMESSVAVPLERQLAGIPHLTAMHARTVVGRTDITLELAPATDPMSFESDAQRAIMAAAPLLPPTLPSPPIFGVLPRVVVRFIVHAHDQVAARTWAEHAATRIAQDVGVEPTLCGGAHVETTVAVDPILLATSGRSIAELADALRSDGADPHALTPRAVRDVAKVTTGPVPFDCKAVDAAGRDVVSVAVYAPGATDGIRTRVLAAIPAPPAGADIDVLPERVLAVVVVDGDLAAIRGALARSASTAELVVEQGTTDERARAIDPHLIVVHVALEPAAIVSAVTAALVAGGRVLDRSQTIVELRGADRDALGRVADQLAGTLHVVTRPAQLQTSAITIDRDAAAGLGVSTATLDATLYAAMGRPRFGSARDIVLTVPGELPELLELVWVETASGAHAPLSSMISVEIQRQAVELDDDGGVPALELRVADPPDAVRRSVATLPDGVTAEVRAAD